ncbi:hypothetical protein ACQ4LE_006056, partial [Meloidogyne hapla]
MSRRYNTFNYSLNEKELEKLDRMEEQVMKMSQDMLSFGYPPIQEQPIYHPFVQPQFTNNNDNPLLTMQQNRVKNIQQNIPTEKPNNNVTYPNVVNCGTSNIQNGWIVENLNFQIENDSIELVINLKNSTIEQKEKTKTKATIDAIKFIEKLLVDGSLKKDDTDNFALEKQNFEEKIKNLEKQINKIKNKNSEENIAIKFLKMHNDHMNEVKTLKDEIKQKLEENLSSKDQLNAILSRINNFLEEEIDEIHEPKQGDEIKKEHVGFLENYYKNCCCYPDERSVSALAFGIDVTRDRVVKWFKSRRRRSRINYEYRKVIEEHEKKIKQKDEQIKEEKNNVEEIKENDTDSDDFLMLSIFDIFGYENEKEKNDI